MDLEVHQSIMTAIKEYLSKYNYIDTIRTLEKESKLLTTHNNSNLIKFFEAGEKDLFFLAWKPLITESSDSLKTEILLHIYFYIYHLNSGESNAAELKSVLQTYNEFISSNQDLFPYFALPFISNPASNSNFSHLFNETWRFDLQKQVFAHIKPKSSNLTALEHLFQAPAPLQSPKSGRILKKISSSPKISTFFPEMTFSPGLPETSSAVSLNFTQICTDLCTLNSETSICALLQALRWKLTQTSAEISSRYLDSYIKNNLLCTTKPHDILLDRLLESSKKVQEFTVKLLNVISFKKPGRDYILTKDSVIPNLFKIITTEKSKSSLRTYTLSLLQKLSLSKTGQILMISQNFIKWILKVMRKEVTAVDEEMIEFCSGILMNLSVRSTAKAKFLEVQSDIIPCIIKYLNFTNEQVVKYTFCLLYSLMGYKSLREVAKKYGIEKVLKGLRGSYEHNEIDAILEQVQNENDVDTSLVNDIEAEDIQMNDDDLDDVISDSRVLKGNDLLKSRYEHKPSHPEKLAKEVFGSRDKIPRTPYN